MKINSFEDIIAWQKAKLLSLAIYEIFKSCRDYSFTDQLRRAVVSVMNNIAEGFERSGDREFRKFLFIAKGSCGEVRSMLSLALGLRYISQNDYDKLSQLTIEVSKILSGLIKTMRN